MTAVIVRQSVCKRIYFLSDQTKFFGMFLMAAPCFWGEREKHSTIADVVIHLYLIASV